MGSTWVPMLFRRPVMKAGESVESRINKTITKGQTAFSIAPIYLS